MMSVETMTRRKTTTPETAVPLKGWLTTTDAAIRLGISRQMVNRMVHAGQFATLQTIGDKPLFIVSVKEIEMMVAVREAKERERAEQN